MKTLILFMLTIILGFQEIIGQTVDDLQVIEQTVKTFFDGFHQKDSVTMTSVLFKQAQIQTIKKSPDNNMFVESEEIETFIKSIISIPESVNFKEVIHEYQIKSDGILATVWTPYSFFMNDTLSHCGTNNFQLIKENGNWKIISIIDTRKKENCKP